MSKKKEKVEEKKVEAEAKKTEREAAKSAEQISRERLSRITKTRKHRLRTNNRVLKYGAKSFMRNTWLSVAAIAIMAVTLIVLSATLIATHSMRTAIAKIESEVEMSVYVKQATSTRDIEKIAERMRALETVAEVSYVSPQEANNDAIRQIIAEGNITDEDFINSLYEAPNKIPWTINVKLVSLDDYSELENFVNNDSSMQGKLDARPPSYSSSHRETIDHIASIMNRIQYIGLGAAGVFALIAVLVVFNTIRMAIFNRKEEIYMMRLVGASRWFIVGPFVVEAAIYGVISALIACGAVYSVSFLVVTRLDFGSTIEPTLEIMRNYWYFALAALLVTGITIGVISSLLATRKYLKIK